MTNTDEILRDARDHMSLVNVMESEIRLERKRCGNFLALNQWKQEIRDARGDRATLVIDQIGQYKDQVVNDWRRNRLGIKIDPADEQGDEEFAAVIEGDIRQCEYMSKAHIAYDWAMDCMTGMNAGFLKVYTRRRAGTFKKDFWIGKIADPDCVYMDPFCQEPDYSDQRKCLVVSRLSKAQYIADYGKTAAIQDFEAYVGDQNLANWITTEAITVAEWWVVEERKRKIQLLTQPIAVIRNNRALTTDTVYSDEYEDLPEGVEISRNSDGDLMEDDEPERIVWQYVVNGVEILSKTRWDGQYIPVVPMLGREMYLNGKKLLFSLISRGLDSQRALNYAISSMVERLGQFPKMPVIGMTGQFKTDGKQWANMNNTLYAYLQFDPVKMEDGSLYTERPQRPDLDPHIDQFVTVSGLFNQLLKGNIGMYGANLGDREGKVRSGAAEKALQSEGDNAEFDFLDNGARALELVGKIIVDAWPHVRTGQDTLTIRDNQGKTKHVAINQKLEHMPKVPKGQKRPFMVSDIQWHVAVTAAPSNDTKRLEDAQFATDIYKELSPEQQVKVAPIMLRHQDSTVAREMADALDPPKEGEQLPPAIMQKMQAAQKTIAALTQEVHALNDEKDAKTAETDAAWRKACLDAYVKIEVAKINASKDADNVDATNEAAFLRQNFEHAHEVGLKAMEMGRQQQQDAGAQSGASDNAEEDANAQTQQQ